MHTCTGIEAARRFPNIRNTKCDCCGKLEGIGGFYDLWGNAADLTEFCGPNNSQYHWSIIMCQQCLNDRGLYMDLDDCRFVLYCNKVKVD